MDRRELDLCFSGFVNYLDKQIEEVKMFNKAKGELYKIYPDKDSEPNVEDLADWKRTFGLVFDLPEDGAIEDNIQILLDKIEPGITREETDIIVDSIKSSLDRKFPVVVDEMECVMKTYEPFMQGEPLKINDEIVVYLLQGCHIDNYPPTVRSSCNAQLIEVPLTDGSKVVLSTDNNKLSIYDTKSNQTFITVAKNGFDEITKGDPFSIFDPAIVIEALSRLAGDAAQDYGKVAKELGEKLSNMMEHYQKYPYKSNVPSRKLQEEFLQNQTKSNIASLLSDYGRKLSTGFSIAQSVSTALGNKDKIRTDANQDYNNIMKRLELCNLGQYKDDIESAILNDHRKIADEEILTSLWIGASDALTSFIIEDGSYFVGGVVGGVAGGVVSGYINGLAGETAYSWASGKHLSRMREINELPLWKECDRNPDNEEDSPDANSNDQQDPSGYVYEAVTSNRLPGVTASIYKKEVTTDMYGDKSETAVFWDAERYMQQNPQTTDDMGKYGWDVPQGEWQVRFSKPGYEPEETEWLPVPPPQLDVNIVLESVVL